MPHNGPFPSKEADRNSYYNAAAPYILVPANTTRFGVSATNKNNLTTGLASWNTAFGLTQNPDTCTKTAIENKNVADKNMQTVMRAIFNDIPESVLTNQDRTTLNLPVTDKHSTPAPVPSTRPNVMINAANRLEHGLSVKDESTPNSSAKPDGVRGCQIWMKVGGEAPADVKEMRYVATITKSPFINHFDGADAGKVIYYWARWENTRSETGPWSTMVAATVVA